MALSNCPRCGVDLPSATPNFCRDCGQRLVSAVPPPVPPSVLKKTQSPKPKILSPFSRKVLIAFGVFCAAFIALCAIIDFFDTDPMPTASPPVAVAQPAIPHPPSPTPTITPEQLDPLEQRIAQAKMDLLARFTEDQRKQIYFEWWSEGNKIDKTTLAKVNDSVPNVDNYDPDWRDKARKIYAQISNEGEIRQKNLDRSILLKYKITSDQLTCLAGEGRRWDKELFPQPTPIVTPAPTPYPDTLHARVTFDGAKFTITNLDDFAWVGVTLKINYGVFNDGYYLKAFSFSPGHTYEVGALQFANGKHERFNPFTMKPVTFQVESASLNGTGFCFFNF